MIDLNQMAENMFNVTLQRQKNGANINTNPLAMLKHCATEVVEATEAYSKIKYFPQLNLNEQEIEKEHFAEELADIIACVLITSDCLGIDIEKALRECYEKNKARAELKGDKK